jgi:hypothetical protein
MRNAMQSIPATLDPERVAAKLAAEFGFTNDRAAVEQLTERLSDVFTETVVSMLTPEQFQAFLAALRLENDEDSQMQIARITSGVPGLYDVVTAALEREAAMLRVVMAM